MAKRKPTSRPRADPARRSARQPAGDSTAPPEPPGSGLRAAIQRFGFLIVAVVAIGGAVAYGVVQGNRERNRGFEDATTDQATQAPFRSNQKAASGQPVKQVSAHTCGTCHTLRRAGVQGIIGPDLDRTVLTRREVREMIRTGSLDTRMPRNLLVGRDADRVARYVAEQSLASRRARANR
ncbi:MAG TPA: cytochrome c [Solirubrobacteraceae bacterium]|nr:cytochrome c [Solirubrobacteraceae bacterium]